ncbi:PadR family transcriptional regulator [Blautia sp. An46]|uniref:PadR family transcriptional regulator n=1 Tax=Blautia sp. An46 TaxID=1965636 RepID=UPI00111FF72C|nr:PadR family transcriptional regulator [Blautia sp. An46]
MNIEKWKSQILRGTLEYCVLLLLRQTPRYGYEILQELNAYPFIAPSILCSEDLKGGSP